MRSRARAIGNGGQLGDPDALGDFAVKSGENLRPGIALHAQFNQGLEGLLEIFCCLASTPILGARV